MAPFEGFEGPTDSRTGILSELHALLGLAIPAVVVSMSTFALALTDQIMVGHLGREAMAAAAIGDVMLNLVLYFQLGFLSGLSTKASQAYGARDKRLIVTWWAASAATGLLTALPMMLALNFAEDVTLHALRQTPETAAMVGAFCTRLAPSIVPSLLAQSLVTVLQAQNFMWWPVIISLTAFVVNIGLNFLFIGLFGFVGSPLATTASRVVQLLLAALAALRVRREQMAEDAARLVPLDKGALEWAEVWRCICAGFKLPKLISYLQLGLPGGLMTALEAWSFDITTAMAGFLGPAQLDAHVAMMSIIAFNFFSFPFGIATAATIRVGNLLGEGEAARARRAAWLSVALGAGSMACCAGVMFVARDVLSYIFIDDAAVHEFMRQVVVIACCFEILDGTMGTTQGALRGMGRQFELMVCNVLGFWLFGFSSGYLLTFRLRLGLPGLWLGMLVGLNVAATISIARLLVADWDREAEQAKAAQELAKEAVYDIELGGVDVDGDASGRIGRGCSPGKEDRADVGARGDRKTDSDFQLQPLLLVRSEGGEASGALEQEADGAEDAGRGGCGGFNTVSLS